MTDKLFTPPTAHLSPPGYPYPEWAKAVTTAPDLHAAIERNNGWASCGWTMDYMVEAANAGQANRDMSKLIALMQIMTCAR